VHRYAIAPRYIGHLLSSIDRFGPIRSEGLRKARHDPIKTTLRLTAAAEGQSDGFYEGEGRGGGEGAPLHASTRNVTRRSLRIMRRGLGGGRAGPLAYFDRTASADLRYRATVRQFAELRGVYVIKYLPR